MNYVFRAFDRARYPILFPDSRKARETIPEVLALLERTEDRVLANKSISRTAKAWYLRELRKSYLKVVAVQKRIYV